MPEDASIIVVTDLDGTLLDHDTYSAEEATPALELLRERGVRVVLCSSKTRAEMRVIARALGLEGPFIAENGGVIAWPRRAGDPQPPDTMDGDTEWVLPLGVRRGELEHTFEAVRAALRLDLVDLATLDAGELSRRTGLSLEAAARARQREWSVPFFAAQPLTPAEETALAHAVAARGLTLTAGGRFWHLQGPGGKAAAVRQFRSWSERTTGRTATLIALGDAPNDAEMLAAADVAIIVPGANREVTQRLRALVPGARLAPAAGPRGWNMAVLAVLLELDGAGPNKT